MKLRKRFLAAFLTLTMLLTFVPFGGVVAEETTTETEVTLSDIDANTTTGKAVKELVKLGIINGYEDGTFRPDNTITRGEIAKIIISFMGLQDVAYETVPSGFADVDAAGGTGHWAKKYIKLAADQKIVNGYPDGTFMPDAPVRYTEIVKMLVCMLGYGSIAEDRTIEGGTWYSGYMAVAAEKGILKGATVNNVEDNASRGTVAILTYNCLDVEVAETNSKGETIINTGSTAIDKFQGKEKITGVVTGVQQTGITTGATGLNARQITVEVKGEEKVFQVPNNYDTMSILGRKISAYVEEADVDGDNKITQISVEKTESTVVTPDMIDEVTSNSISYYESETSSRAKKIAFDKIKVIYNGKYDGTFKNEEFGDVTSGKIEFVCNDGDGDAEVAFVSAYENYVVNNADKTAEPPKIYAKYNAGELEIPYDESGIYFSLTKTGSTAEPETIVKSLSQWDVISVMKSKDSAEGRSVWNGIVTSKRVSGKIEQSDGATRKKIGNTFYDYAANFEKYEGTKPEMNLGDYVTVYLDHEGKIAAAAASATETNVYMAYMLTAAKKSGVDGETQVSIYGITGTTKKQTLTLASPVRIDGESHKDGTAAMTALKAAAAEANKGKAEAGATGAKEYSQLIRYTKNSKGEIDTIDTVMENTSVSEDDLELTVAYPYSGKALSYAQGNRFESNGSLVFMGSSSVKVLEIPYDNFTNSDDFVIRSFTSAFSLGIPYRVEAYNVSDTKMAGFVISYKGGGAGTAVLNDLSPMMVVTKISSVLDENDSTVTIDEASGYDFPGGSAVDVQSETAGTLIDTYKFGDIFRYAVSDGQIIESQKVLSFGTNNKPVIYNCNPKADAGVKGTDITKAIAEEDKAKAADLAKEQRSFKIDDTGRSDAETRGRFVFGTVLGVDLDAKQIRMTPTIKEDKAGIQEVHEEVYTLGNAKVFLYDYTASKDTNKIVVDAALDNIKSYKALLESSADTNDASQVLVYYTGAYAVKAIIIFKY